MILEHLGKRPVIDPAAYVAPSATVCGDVHLGAGARIMHGACVVAEGGRIEIGHNVIVLQNAVVRSTARWSTTIGDHSLIGPNAHLAGCTIEDCVFIATGATVFHGSHLATRAEVRIHGVVHVKSFLPARTTVPIGWIAVGNPAELFPPEKHDEIWTVQEKLGFSRAVYGVEPATVDGPSKMPEVARRLAEIYGSHREDRILDDTESDPTRT